MNVKELKVKFRHMCEQADESYADLMDAMTEANSIPPFLLPYLMEVTDNEVA